MIKAFKHKRLQQFFEKGTIKGIQAKHAKKLKNRLSALDTAQTLDDMKLPGFGLHPLVGNSDGMWSIIVNGNWRVTFTFGDGDAYILNYEDYY
ncbi:type II toxin-antitoxin system RelE/ParE family toxin [Sulfurimonas sp. MAG313]|nr:type II toxin-antitoxin system RelE/ParE family toxin [Sulfurimonas sp. MAG313]MDF1881930.1 type II toxin-antitoxin system RelE/ParE family toxin [Sulfurimonas sp. MAG313]